MLLMQIIFRNKLLFEAAYMVSNLLFLYPTYNTHMRANRLPPPPKVSIYAAKNCGLR